ncbi:MAG: branched-chain amino acid ABC transporter permease [Eubacteriales bacterium]|nr:branched-chain amino acid ABC transporter permease [Eubacteriales bacterium]
MSKKTDRIISALLLVALLVLAVVLDKTLPTTHIALTVLKKGCIWSLIVVSMNLLNGFTGLFSLGHAGFMLIGGYTFAVLTIPVADRASVYQYYDGGIIQFCVPMIVGLLAAGVVAAIMAWLIGLPVLRLKSDYLAIATLGFSEIVRAFFQWDTMGPITNGSNMLRKFPSLPSLLFAVVASGICIAVIVMIINSSYGRAFKAIRDDEIAAEAMGINLAKHKRMAFCISSFFAGIGGALFAMYQGTLQAMTFKTALTYELLLIVVIGGLGSVTGSILASFLYIACSEWWLRFLDSEMTIGGFKVPLLRSGFRMVVFSIIIMVIVLFARKGIMGDKEFSVSGLVNFFKNRGKKKEVK